MKFAYTYRTSDGQRHSAEIEAENRDAAFARLRNELGIRAIRVTAVDREAVKGSNGLKGPIGLVVLALVIVMGLWWWFVARSANAPYHVMTPQGPVAYTVAQPLPRQMIPGDRARIEAAIGGDGVFRSAAEAYLARFAEPGRPSQSSHPSQMSQESRTAEFERCLGEPVRIASTDFTEVVDLKRIVAGMKREMRAYLAGGGTVEQYLAELEKRQQLEVSYRENAERRLNEMLDRANRATAPGEAHPPNAAVGRELQAAYLYWLKANAQLQSMGIYLLPLSPALRAYQQTQPFDEEMP